MNAEDAEEYTQALGQVVAGGWRQVALGERLGVPEALGLSTRDWVEDRLGGYVRLSIPDRREAVAELTEEGMSTRDIGDVLGVDQKTVSNDRRSGEESSSPEPESTSTPQVEPGLEPKPEEDSSPALGDLTEEPVRMKLPSGRPTEYAKRQDQIATRGSIYPEWTAQAYLGDGDRQLLTAALASTRDVIASVTLGVGFEKSNPDGTRFWCVPWRALWSNGCQSLHVIDSNGLHSREEA